MLNPTTNKIKIGQGLCYHKTMHVCKLCRHKSLFFMLKCLIHTSGSIPTVTIL